LRICRRPQTRTQNCTGALIRHSDRAICPKARTTAHYCPITGGRADNLDRTRMSNTVVAGGGWPRHRRLSAVPSTVATMTERERPSPTMEDGRVLGIPAELIHAIGRVTIAAGELELVLAAVSATQTRENAFVILAKPGEPLRAARRSMALMVSPYREEFLPVLERAAELLAKRHSVVHAMLINESPARTAEDWTFLHYRTYKRYPADPSTLDQLATEILEIRARLLHILSAQINNR
jgi:hypothetical protein